MVQQNILQNKGISVGKSFYFSVADNCCDDHLDEEVRFYCTDCTVLICDECVQSIHKTHDFKSFKKVVKEHMDTNGTQVTTRYSDKFNKYIDVNELNIAIFY
jgi:hypothetical protein